VWVCAFEKRKNFDGSEKRTETKNLKHTKKNEAKNGSGFFARALSKKAKWIFFSLHFASKRNIFQSETGAPKFISGSYSKFSKVKKSVFVFTFSQYYQSTPVVYLSRPLHWCTIFNFLGPWI
jgi:hypothetical protein